MTVNPLPTGQSVDLVMRLLEKPRDVIVNGHSPKETENGSSASEHPKLKVSWDTVSGATAYRIEYRKECYADKENYKTKDTKPEYYVTVRPHPCDGNAEFEKHELVVPAETDGDRFETATISGLRRDTPLELGAVYKVHVRALFGDSFSSLSPPVIGYSSDAVPERVMTMPLAARLPVADAEADSDVEVPVYRYTICSGTATKPSENKMELAVFPVSSKQVSDIKAAIETWKIAPAPPGFWTARDDAGKGSGSLIKLIHEPDRQSECGVGGNLEDDNHELNEIKLIGPNAMAKICNNARAWGCADLATSTDIDIYLKYDLSLSEIPRRYGTCSELSNIASHEVGHALGILAARVPDGWGEYHNALNHSHIKPSIMHGQWGLNPEARLHCAPSYYDVGALIAAYQTAIASASKGD